MRCNILICNQDVLIRISFEYVYNKVRPISIINSVTMNTYFPVLTYLSLLYHNLASVYIYIYTDARL
jgi:hypothetical protein